LDEDPPAYGVQVLTLDAGGELILRPRGTASPWRFKLGLGFAVRRFGLGKNDPPDPTTVPGFFRGATSLTTRFVVEHVSDFDASRGRAGLDAALEIAPTVGLGWDDDSRYLSLLLHATYGQPLGGGRAVV